MIYTYVLSEFVEWGQQDEIYQAEQSMTNKGLSSKFPKCYLI